MATPTPTPTGVHLVGSIPSPDASHVFHQACSALPGRLRRLPDGETGARFYFVMFQRNVFSPSPGLLNDWNPMGDDPPKPGPDAPQPTPAAITLHPTGYDDAALASYATFQQLRDRGVIPAGVRFQVSLPTPVNVIAAHVAAAHQAVAEPAYEAQLLRALRRIQDGIPAADLAVQWDVAVEFAMLEGAWQVFRPWFEPVREGVAERLARLAGMVDAGVEMGFHLCYGDIEHQHFVQPKDMGCMVDMANMIGDRVRRPIHWLHMPVPKDRVDDAYFAPLATLRLDPGTELFLGLVHPDDEAGARERIKAAARNTARGFGVATECGMGRTPKNELDSIFAISAAVSAPYS